MARREAVIFDIGNVLIGWQPERFFDREVGEARRREMFAAVDLHGMNDRIDAGEPFGQVVRETAAATPGFEAEIALWHDRWIELTGPVIDGSVHLLQRLKARGVPVFALTNFGRETYEVARPVYPFLDAFDRAFVSGHIGTIKPDPAIYAHVEDESGVAPEALLFTDDRADNIAAAEARGWGVHHFNGAEGLAARLVAEGLLSEEDARW